METLPNEIIKKEISKHLTTKDIYHLSQTEKRFSKMFSKKLKTRKERLHLYQIYLVNLFMNQNGLENMTYFTRAKTQEKAIKNFLYQEESYILLQFLSSMMGNYPNGLIWKKNKAEFKNERDKINLFLDENGDDDRCRQFIHENEPIFLKFLNPESQLFTVRIVEENHMYFP